MGRGRGAGEASGAGAGLLQKLRLAATGKRNALPPADALVEAGRPPERTVRPQSWYSAEWEPEGFEQALEDFDVHSVLEAAVADSTGNLAGFIGLKVLDWGSVDRDGLLLEGAYLGAHEGQLDRWMRREFLHRPGAAFLRLQE